MAKLSDDDPRHGTVNGYTNFACRCVPCRAAYSIYQVPKAREKRRIGIPPGHPAHGTDNGYTNFGCRCTWCKAARSQKIIKKPAQAA